MTTARQKAEETAKKVADGDAEYATSAAEANDGILARTAEPTKGEVEASLRLNDPSGSHNSYRDEKLEKKLADKREKEAE